MIRLHLLTRCTRLHNLPEIEESIKNNIPDSVKVEWYIIFDTGYFSSIPMEVLEKYSKYHLRYRDNKGHGMEVFNDILSDIMLLDDGVTINDWFYILDDDNIIHPDFYKVFNYVDDYTTHGVLFNQYIGGKDWTGLEIREIKSNNIKVREVDSAQFMLRLNFWNNLYKSGYGFGSGYLADGEFIEMAYKIHRSIFMLIDEVLCYYNYIEDKTEGEKSNSLVNTVLISDENSYKDEGLEKVNLTVLKNKDVTVEDIRKYNPNSIITFESDWRSVNVIPSTSIDIRQGWVNFSDGKGDLKSFDNLAFEAGMYNILDLRRDNLISVFTPAYNTEDGLYAVYESLRAQSYDNWEWVIVNDSTDGERTQKIIDDICSKDFRVRSYRMSFNSRGNIGFVKYFACSMTRGKLLVELDHDDHLLSFALSELWKAYEQYPECGFFYSDCIEYNPSTRQSLQYPDGWAFGYGSYYDFEYKGVHYKAAKAPNINPKTIRHIVSSPNHVRVWERDLYFRVGGHNRNLKVADDYELMVRSFLNTIMCRIAKPLYMQIQHGNNTTDKRRADIQHKVHYISSFYNGDISNRFQELGRIDWAYGENPQNPLMVRSKFDVEESYINYTYN